MYKDKNILVTGGTGLLGRELVELLANAGAKVRSISLDDNNLNPLWGAEHFKADLRNIKNCISACAGMDYVFHIAGVKGSPVVARRVSESPQRVPTESQRVSRELRRPLA